MTPKAEALPDSDYGRLAHLSLQERLSLGQTQC